MAKAGCIAYKGAFLLCFFDGFIGDNEAFLLCFFSQPKLEALATMEL
jgi:hypothetical protein